MESLMIQTPAIEEINIIIDKKVVDGVAKTMAMMKEYPEVTCNEDKQVVEQIDMDAVRIYKEIEANRVEAKAPFLKIGKEIDAACKPLLEQLDQAKRHTANILMKWQKQLQAIADEHRRKQEEEARQIEEQNRKAARDAEIARRKANTPVASVPAPAPIPIPMKTVIEVPKSTIKTRKVTKLRIKNAELIPIRVTNVNPETKEVSDVMLRPVDEAAVMKAIKDGWEIPGAELYEEEVAVH